MRALVLGDEGRLSLQDRPAPARGGECVLRVAAAGICGTDLELLRGYAGFTRVPGHEFVGVVEQRDPGVERCVENGDGVRLVAVALRGQAMHPSAIAFMRRHYPRAGMEIALRVTAFAVGRVFRPAGVQSRPRAFSSTTPRSPCQYNRVFGGNDRVQVAFGAPMTTPKTPAGATHDTGEHGSSTTRVGGCRGSAARVRFGFKEVRSRRAGGSRCDVGASPAATISADRRYGTRHSRYAATKVPSTAPP